MGAYAVICLSLILPMLVGASAPRSRGGGRQRAKQRQAELPAASNAQPTSPCLYHSKMDHLWMRGHGGCSAGMGRQCQWWQFVNLTPGPETGPQLVWCSVVQICMRYAAVRFWACHVYVYSQKLFCLRFTGMQQQWPLWMTDTVFELLDKLLIKKNTMWIFFLKKKYRHCIQCRGYKKNMCKLLSVMSSTDAPYYRSPRKPSHSSSSFWALFVGFMHFTRKASVSGMGEILLHVSFVCACDIRIDWKP